MRTVPDALGNLSHSLDRSPCLASMSFTVVYTFIPTVERAGVKLHHGSSRRSRRKKYGKLTVMKIAACLLSNSDGQKSSGSARARWNMETWERQQQQQSLHDGDDRRQHRQNDEISIYLYINNKPVSVCRSHPTLDCSTLTSSSRSNKQAK